MSQDADAGYSHDDYVPVVYAHDWAEAKYYKVLLEDHAIPVIIAEEDASEHNPPKEGGGVLVMTPEEYLSEAQDIIERASDESELDEDLDDFGGEEDNELADLSVMEDLNSLGGRVVTDEEEEVF